MNVNRRTEMNLTVAIHSKPESPVKNKESLHVTELRKQSIEFNDNNMDIKSVMIPTNSGARMSSQKRNQASLDHRDYRLAKRTVPSHNLTYTLSSNKKITLEDLPLGPSREQLEQIFKALCNESQTLAATSKLRHKDTTLERVVNQDDIPRLLLMLGGTININEKFGKNKNTAIHLACTSGRMAIVHILMQIGANTCSLNGNNFTPLMLAVENGHNDIVHYLLKSGVPSDTRGEREMTALHIAAKTGNVEAMHYLYTLDSSLDINVQDADDYTPLAWAADCNKFEAVKYLLDHKADPYACDNEMNRPIHWAAFSADTNVLALILSYAKSSLNTVNNNGDTPLTIAVRRGDVGSVQMLLAHGCDIPDLASPKLECRPGKTNEAYQLLQTNATLNEFYKKANSNRTRILTNDISQGKERFTIQVVNEVDDKSIPPLFQYITDNIEAGNVHVDRNIQFIQSCTCKEDSSCQEASSCLCCTLSYECWFDRNGLTKKFIDITKRDPPMIFECNSTCACSTDCTNRCAQKGIRFRLEVFRTESKGWGVRTLEDIPQGGFVCEYIGEMIDSCEADSREEDIYLFDLDNKTENPEESFCLDAHHYGNVARFINHSCEPCLFPVKFFVEHQDLRFPRIAFFAATHIPAHQELTFDYGYKFWEVKHKEFTCECGTEKCQYSAEKIEATIMRHRAEKNTRLTIEQFCNSNRAHEIDPQSLCDDADEDEDADSMEESAQTYANDARYHLGGGPKLNKIVLSTTVNKVSHMNGSADDEDSEYDSELL